MSIDIMNLPLEASDAPEVDYENYADASEFPPPLADGTYTLKPTKVEFDFKEAQNGSAAVLTAIMSHDVFDPQGNRLGSLNFDRTSDKVFERQGVKVSMMADQLRAWGDRERYAGPQGKAQAVKAHVDAGDTFSAVTKREAFCGHKDTQFAVTDSKKGWTVKGGKIPAGETEVDCPVCHKSVRVNSKVDRRIPKSQ